jgi:hypothetical protein
MMPSAKETLMMKMNTKRTMWIGLLATLSLGACVAGDSDEDTPATSVNEAKVIAPASSQAVYTILRDGSSKDPAITAPSSGSTPSDPLTPIDTTKTAAIDNRICWPVAGLRWETSCDIREDMPSGTGIDFIDRNNYLSTCDGGANIWWHVINHTTGHHGYVRAAALC